MSSKLFRLGLLAGALILVGILAVGVVVLSGQLAESQEVAATAMADSTSAVERQSTAEAEAMLRATAGALAEEQLVDAWQESDLARSRELASLAIQAMLQGDLLEAYQLAIQAYQTAPTAESEHALYSLIYGKYRLPERTFERHEISVNSAAFSPDGTRVVTGDWDGIARIWDAESGSELTVLKGHRVNVSSAVFSPDGRRVVTVGVNTVRLWDAESGAELTVLQGASRDFSSAAFSPDGTRVVTADLDSMARIWDAESGAELATLEGHEWEIYTVAFSPDGNRVVTAGMDGTVKIWVAGGAELLRIAEDRLAGLGTA